MLVERTHTTVLASIVNIGLLFNTSNGAAVTVSEGLYLITRGALHHTTWLDVMLIRFMYTLRMHTTKRFISATTGYCDGGLVAYFI